MQPVQRIFILALAFVATLGAALGVFLYISLIPHCGIISDVAAGVVITGLVCAALFMVSYTFNHIGIHIAKRRTAELHSRVIIAGEVVAVPLGDGSFVHLSAMHEAAKIPRMLPAPKNEEVFSDDETVIELYNDGMTYETIMDATQLKYNKVQRIVADAKKAGKIAR